MKTLLLVVAIVAGLGLAVHCRTMENAANRQAKATEQLAALIRTVDAANRQAELDQLGRDIEAQGRGLPGRLERAFSAINEAR